MMIFFMVVEFIGRWWFLVIDLKVLVFMGYKDVGLKILE